MIERAPQRPAPAAERPSAPQRQTICNNIPGAILTAGGAFAGAVGVLLAIAHYAGAE